jgi:uncharacterized protein (DUF2249 family)
MKPRIIEVDVREDIRAGREPFSRILAAAARVGPTGELVLIAPFEPVPLYNVLAAHGFTHSAREVEGGNWEIRFARGSQDSEGPSTVKRL